MLKNKERKRAIALRKRGLTYSEILQEVSVAKSTLSLWLRDIKLSPTHKKRINKKKKDARKKGALKRHQNKVNKIKRIKNESRREIKKISQRELWLIGIALYWAEGTKEKKHTRSVTTEFANSDHKMVEVYIKWLTQVMDIPKKNILFGIYIHENNKKRIKEVKNHWARATGFSIKVFDYVYYKKHNPKTNRKNTNNNYYGMLRIRVKKSSDLTRKIQGWIEGVCQEVEVV